MGKIPADRGNAKQRRFCFEIFCFSSVFISAIFVPFHGYITNICMRLVSFAFCFAVLFRFSCALLIHKSCTHLTYLISFNLNSISVIPFLFERLLALIMRKKLGNIQKHRTIIMAVWLTPVKPYLTCALGIKLSVFSTIFIPAIFCCDIYSVNYMRNVPRKERRSL